jgi:hypothetical protein
LYESPCLRSQPRLRMRWILRMGGMVLAGGMREGAKVGGTQGACTGGAEDTMGHDRTMMMVAPWRKAPR